MLTITVRIDLEPGGRRELRRRIARQVIYLANDGSGDEATGNYLVFLDDPRRGGGAIARLRGHLRSRGALPLAARALAAVARHLEGGRAA